MKSRTTNLLSAEGRGVDGRGVDGRSDSSRDSSRCEISRAPWFAELQAWLKLLPDGGLNQYGSLPGRFSRGAPLALPQGKLPPEPRFGFWMPHSSRNLPWHCFASSRLGRRLAGNPFLLAALESVCASFRPGAAAILNARGFALAAQVRALSQRYSVRLIELCPLPSKPTRKWFIEQAGWAARNQHFKLFYFHLPMVEVTRRPGRDCEPGRDRDSRQPLCLDLLSQNETQPVVAVADWLAIHLASMVHVLSVRRGGNIEAALRSRLESSSAWDWSVRLLDAPSLTEPRLATALWSAGALRWTLAKPSEVEPATVVSAPTEIRGRKRRTPLQVKEAARLAPFGMDAMNAPTAFLFHWTRCPPMNRRREADSHYQQLLARVADSRKQASPETIASLSGAALPSPLRTLLEILTSGRLLASGRWTGNGQPVVSFSAQPLSRWPELRTYRPHLGRWDFEPYGVGLSRDRLEKLGGRPVIYGDRQTQAELEAIERIWFQMARTRRAGHAIDWTVEREWRVPGDIELRLFGRDEALVFVPDKESAEVVAPYSRWPVIAIAERTVSPRG
ncbi:MAG: hypothetical protein ACK53V_03415 [Planctomycetota bacterium]